MVILPRFVLFLLQNLSDFLSHEHQTAKLLQGFLKGKITPTPYCCRPLCGRPGHSSSAASSGVCLCLCSQPPGQCSKQEVQKECVVAPVITKGEAQHRQWLGTRAGSFSVLFCAQLGGSFRPGRFLS